MKKVKSEIKYIRRNDIRLPQDKEEFRENLRTYFVYFGDNLFSYTYRKNIIPMLCPKYEFIIGYDDQIDLIKKEFRNMSWYYINGEIMLEYSQMVLGSRGSR